MDLKEPWVARGAEGPILQHRIWKAHQKNLLRTLVQHTVGSIEIDNTALQGYESRIYPVSLASSL